MLEDILILALLFVAIATATYAFWQGLKEPESINWSAIKFGMLVLALICIGFVVLGFIGVMGVVVGIGLGFYTFIGALVAGLILVVMLSGKRKWFAAIMGILFPATIFLSIVIGHLVSPDSERDQMASAITDALQQYHIDNGQYPTELNDLVPGYLSSLPQPGTMWGWLYAADGQDYTLGYVQDIDRWGYFICIRTPEIHNWDCVFPDDENYSRVGQFNLPVTPFPGTPIPYTNP